MDRRDGPPPFAKILAPVDGSPSSEIAVRRSLALMTAPGCQLTLLYVGEDDKRRRRIKEFASKARGWGVETSVRFQAGRPAAVILREIEVGKHDLVLMTCRRRWRMTRALPGHITVSVLRRSPAPLLLYRPLADLDESFFAVERSEPAKFRNLILMLDGSEHAEGVIEFSLKLARAFQSELILLQAIDRAEVTQDRMEAARAYLAEFAETAGRQGISARIQIAVGDPAEQALRMLDGGADSIALTTRGRSFWRSTFLGSVALRILSVAEGPILCISSSVITRNSGRKGRSRASEVSRTPSPV
jgi:nucleotide-binding universal stress UspA family protein